MVGTVKNCLKKTIGRSLLTFEEFRTVVLEVEAVVNSRPLTYLYTDIQEGEPLSPAHFLSGRRLTTIPVRSTKEKTDDDDDLDFIPDMDREGLRRNVNKITANMARFWSCWRKEYLVNLREFDQVQKRKLKSNAEPVVGEVVILNDQLPRSRWKLGRIISLIPGKDGVVRAARVKCGNGSVLQRSIEHLYPMEVRTEKEDSEENGISDTDVIGDTDVVGDTDVISDTYVLGDSDVIRDSDVILESSGRKSKRAAASVAASKIRTIAGENVVTDK